MIIFFMNFYMEWFSLDLNEIQCYNGNHIKFETFQDVDFIDIKF